MSETVEIIAAEKPQKIAKRNGNAEPATPIALIEMAVSKGAGIEVIERLKAIYDQEREKAQEQEFNAAMNRVQANLVRIAPDLNNSHTSSKYASYAAIDKVLRPIYSKEGFSVSFNTEEAKLPDYVKVVCFVSHSGGYTRKYQVEMPADGKGAKGNDVMTKTHATGSAMSYGKRYLAGFVWNLAIGLDDDGNAAAGLPQPDLDAILKRIIASENLPQLSQNYREALKSAIDGKHYKSIEAIDTARAKRKEELESAQ